MRELLSTNCTTQDYVYFTPTPIRSKANNGQGHQEDPPRPVGRDHLYVPLWEMPMEEEPGFRKKLERPQLRPRRSGPILQERGNFSLMPLDNPSPAALVPGLAPRALIYVEHETFEDTEGSTENDDCLNASVSSIGYKDCVEQDEEFVLRYPSARLAAAFRLRPKATSCLLSVL